MTDPARARFEKWLAKRYEAVFVRRDLSAGYDPTSAIDEMVGIAADAIEKVVLAERGEWWNPKLKGPIPWDAVSEGE